MGTVSKQRADNFFKEYLRQWAAAVKSNPQKAASAYVSSLYWTDFHMEKILKEVNILYPNSDKRYVDYKKKETWQTEYYRLDLGFYEFKQGNDWFLDYAIEHENARFKLRKDKTIMQSGWLSEFAKLIPLNCLLKVIVSYDHFDIEESNEATAQEKIEYAAALLNSHTKARPQIDKTPFLIILASSLHHWRTHRGEIRGFYIGVEEDEWKSERLQDSDFQAELDAVKEQYKAMEFSRE